MGVLALFGVPKDVLMIVLIGIAVLAFAAPAALEKLKNTARNWLEGIVEKKIGVNIFPDQLTTKSTSLAATEDDIVMKRVSEIKAKCPGAPPDAVLKWTEQGFNVERSKDAYIALLTKKDATAS